MAEQWPECATLVVAEFKRATEKFDKFNSAHEGWAVLREEVDNE